MLTSLVAVLKEMTEKRGRDTERTLFGDWGRYETKLSKKTFLSAAPSAGGKSSRKRISAAWCIIARTVSPSESRERLSAGADGKKR